MYGSNVLSAQLSEVSFSSVGMLDVLHRYL